MWTCRSPPSGEYTTTVGGVNYQLLEVMHAEVAQYWQLRTMASDAADPIDWPRIPPHQLHAGHYP